ncbi:MAG TPA: hypothetical protein VD930_01410 [Gemmatimonadales bacterium]|nr:hypothetical protein [Gemmatimonadales bacterium]
MIKLCWLAGLGMVMLTASVVGAQQQPATAFSSWEAVSGTPTNIPSAAVVPDSVRVHSGYQHWRGAWMGAAIGGALGALWGTIGGAVARCDDCSRHPSARDGALAIGMLGAGAGALVGFVAGLASPRYVWVHADEGAR